MPITSLRLQNFRCFRDSGALPIAPLTIIFGRNNAGKSTILQSLLVLRQTLDAAGYESRLNLRGPLFAAGSYADMVHDHKTRLNLSIGLGVAHRGISTTQVTLEYSADEPRPPRLASLSIAARDYPPVDIRRGRGAGGPFELYVNGQLIGGEKTANFSFPVHGLLPVIGDEPSRVGRPTSGRADARSNARRVLEYLEGQLQHLRALGAFRHPPQRRYEYGGYLRNAIDSEGRNVVDALIDDTTRRGRERGRLIREVNNWLKTVGNVQLLPIRRLSRSARIFELRLKNPRSGRWANFADVGSGIGQSFPVIVEGLRTPRDGTFLVQEPEIHLHPDAQLGMGDFLFALAASGRHVIAETHSENILLRIRRRVIDSHELSHSDVSILVVDQNESGASTVRSLAVDELGQAKDWPRGFMEDAARERLALMKAMAK